MLMTVSTMIQTGCIHWQLSVNILTLNSFFQYKWPCIQGSRCQLQNLLVWTSTKIWPGNIMNRTFAERLLLRWVQLSEYDIFRGGSRGRVQGLRTPPPSPEMTCGSLIQLVFTSGHQSVTPFLSGAPPPKKNPGSAPDLIPCNTSVLIRTNIASEFDLSLIISDTIISWS